MREEVKYDRAAATAHLTTGRRRGVRRHFAAGLREIVRRFLGRIYGVFLEVKLFFCDLISTRKVLWEYGIIGVMC